MSLAGRVGGLSGGVLGTGGGRGRTTSGGGVGGDGRHGLAVFRVLGLQLRQPPGVAHANVLAAEEPGLALVAVDAGADLAVLEVDTAEVAPVEWAERVPGVGAAVLAVSRGHGGTRVTVGFVSGVQRSFRGPRGRRIDGGLEHTAAMARGSSGGPLVDQDGRLVGLNTHRLGEGFYLAQAAEPELVARITALVERAGLPIRGDRKSTRLNSSH